MSRRRAKRRRRSAITSRRCAWIAAITGGARPANLYRAESPEKASAWIAGLPPAQRRSIDDIERSLTNDRLEKQAQALESQGNWAQAAEVQRRRLALDPDSVWITYRLARDLVSAGERRRPTR